MTAVVALACRDGSVVLGGDSYFGDETYRDLCASPKVWRAGSLGVAICGAVAAETAFRSAVLEFGTTRRLTERALVDELPGFLRERMEDVLDEHGKLEDSGYLLAFGGSIYGVEPDLGVWKCARHYTATGAGGALVSAAVAMVAQCPCRSTSEAVAVIKRALRVAERLHPKVMAPFRTVIVRGEGA